MSHTELEPQVPATARLVSVDGKTYPLESAELRAHAEGGIAATTLVQTFANPYTEPLEVAYNMPLPADGAVLGYTITIGDRVIRGEVQPREQAAAAYKQALYEGRTAGLLEQQRADTFEQRLGNVPPGTSVQVSIDVLHPLAFLTPELPPIAGDMIAQVYDARRVANWEYRFPTVVGVRYLGAPGRVPDATELSPDRGSAGSIPVRMEFMLGIDDELSALPTSPSHRIDHSPIPHDVFINGQPLDRDVVIRWPAATAEIGVHIAEGLGLPGDDGRYALVTVVPPAQPKATYHRDVTVLLDASGSMSGLPLDLAKVVVGDLLRSLQPGDRFELLAFSNGTSRLTPALTKVDERSLASALAALRNVKANGGTEMASAVTEALKCSRAEAQRQVVLVTDGDIGFEHEVVGQITAQNNVRLHVVGVGHVPNRTLTQQAAAAGRGLELLVATHADASAASQRLIVGTANPVLTNVSIGGTALAGDAPTQLRDVFAGQPLVFAVELSRMGGSLEVTGNVAGSASSWSHELRVPAAEAIRSDDEPALDVSALPLGALYGREVVARLELIRAGLGYHRFGTHDAVAPAVLDHEIEHVAMRHRIVSRRTSLVAIAEEPSVDPRAPRRRERLAVEMPAGVSAAGVGFEMEDRMVMARSAPLMVQSVIAKSAPPSARARWAVPDMFEAMKRSFGGPEKTEEVTAEAQHRQEQEARTRAAREKAERWASYVDSREHEGGEEARSEILDRWFRSLSRQGVTVTRVVWLEPNLVLVDIELRSPCPNAPARDVEVQFQTADGKHAHVTAELVFEHCEVLEHNREASRVRLAIRLPGGAAWPASKPVHITWMSRVRDPFRDMHEVTADLDFIMPREVSGESRPPGHGGR